MRIENSHFVNKKSQEVSKCLADSICSAKWQFLPVGGGGCSCGGQRRVWASWTWPGLDSWTPGSTYWAASEAPSPLTTLTEPGSAALSIYYNWVTSLGPLRLPLFHTHHLPAYALMLTAFTWELFFHYTVSTLICLPISPLATVLYSSTFFLSVILLFSVGVQFVAGSAPLSRSHQSVLWEHKKRKRHVHNFLKGLWYTGFWHFIFIHEFHLWRCMCLGTNYSIISMPFFCLLTFSWQ